MVIFMKQTVYLSALFLLVSALTACGFQLRGQHTQAYNIEKFAMNTSERFDDVSAAVLRTAEGRGIEVNPQADWSITLGEEKLEQWRASTSQDYTKNEYWLSLSVDLIIENRQQDIEYRPINLKRQAIFQDNTDSLNSKSSEKSIILRELRQQLAEQVLMQLSYIMQNPPKCCAEQELESEKVETE